jgi:hypothetical protein
MTVFTRHREIQRVHRETIRTGSSSTRAGWPLEVWGVLAVALLLRLPGLLHFDLWQDEIYSIYEAKYLYHSPIGPGGMELRPLYFMLLHPLADGWPKSTALLRLPSLLFGLAGIAASWWLTSRFAGRAPAFVAGVAVALLPMHVNASQLIRWISLAFFIGACLSLAVIRSLETDARRHHAWVLALALAGSFTHVTFLLPQTGLVLGAHLVRDDGRLGFRWPTGRALLTCWLPYLAILGAYYAVLATLVPAERLLGDATGGSAGRLLPALVYHLTPVLLIAAAGGAWWLWRTEASAQRRVALMAVLGMGLPVAIMQVAGLRNMVPVSVLYVSAALPVFLVAVGAVTHLLDPSGQGGRTAVVLGAIVGAALLPGTVSHLADGSRFEYRTPLLEVQRIAPGATVLVYPVIHARWEAPDLDAVEFRPALGTPFLDSVQAAHERFWVIAPMRRLGMLGDRDGAKYRWLVRHCTLQSAWRRPRFDYERYDTELHRCDRAAVTGDRAPAGP